MDKTTFRFLWVYILATAGINLVWEMAHVGLYTLGQTGTWREIAFAVLHCTAGDVLIATVALLIGLVAVGRGFPQQSRSLLKVFGITMIVGLAYTAYSEWYNTTVSKVWAYTDAMPLVPWTTLGLTPMLQWIVVPLFSLWLTRYFTCSINYKKENTL